MQSAFPQSPQRAARLAFAAMVAANLFLAAGPWMVRLADVGPVAAGFWRMALAIPLLLLLSARTSEQRLLAIPQALMATILVAGLFFAADLASWHTGILLTKLANATLFGNASAFLFAIYGFFLLRRLPERAQAAALLLAALGTALLLGSSYELSRQQLVGDLLALLAGVFYTVYLVVIDRARRTLAPMPVLALATIGGTLPLLLAARLMGETIVPGDWTPLILLSLGSQVIGQGLLVYSMGHLSPVVVGIGFLLQPLVTALIGWLAYQEGFGTADAIGALLICAALVLIRLPSRAVATAPPPPHSAP